MVGAACKACGAGLILCGGGKGVYGNAVVQLSRIEFVVGDVHEDIGAFIDSLGGHIRIVAADDSDPVIGVLYGKVSGLQGAVLIHGHILCNDHRGLASSDHGLYSRFRVLDILRQACNGHQEGSIKGGLDLISLLLNGHIAGIIDDVVGAVSHYIVGDIGDGLSGEVHHVIVPAKICLSPDVLHMGQGILFAARCQDHRVDCGIGEVVRTHLEIDLGIVAAVGQGILRRTGGAAACHRAEGSAASLSVHDLITVRSILQDIVGVGAAGKEDVLSGHVLCGQGRLACCHGNGGCGLVRDLLKAFQIRGIGYKDRIGHAQDLCPGGVLCGIAFVVGACRHGLVVGLYGSCGNGVHPAYALRLIELVVRDVHKHVGGGAGGLGT